MTVLGKILAILNLVLSLAVGAFIVMTYVSRTNWQAAFVRQQKAAADGQLVVNAYHDEAEKAKGERTLLEKKLVAAEALARKNQADAEANIKGLLAKLEAQKVQLDQFQIAQANVAKELEQRQREVDLLKQLRNDHETKIKQMEATVQELRNSATDSLLAANSEQERNQRLLAENERLTKDLQKALQAASGGGANGNAARKNPPLEDIEGIVKATDSSGLVTLSVGSDSGLVKGNTLEVYRLKPDPTYLGTIEILAVRPHEAVGKPISRPRGLIQVGDRVSSTIVSRR